MQPVIPGSFQRGERRAEEPADPGPTVLPLDVSLGASKTYCPPGRF